MKFVTPHHRYRPAYLLLIAGLLFAGLVATFTATAQSSIDVEQLQADGSYLDSLEAFDKMSKRQVSMRASTAAAISAQALSLNVRAMNLLDSTLKDPKLTPVEKAVLLIRRGTIEFQEGRFAVAKMFAGRAEETLENPSALRGEAILLGAQSDEATGAFAQAELGYLNALGEVAAEDTADVYYQVAGVQQKLQKYAEARSSLEQIPLQSPHAPDALLRLAEISLNQKDPATTLLLMGKGKDAFPNDFNGGKALYLTLKAAVEQADTSQILAITADVSERFPNSDSWRTLIEATAEEYLAKKRGVT